MKNKINSTNVSEDEVVSIYARFDDGPWYAILPCMQLALSNAGAKISVVPSAQKPVEG